MIKFFFVLIIFSFFSCNSSHDSLISRNKNFKVLDSTKKVTINLQEQNVTFIGTGHTPVNWNLQMSFDDTVRFEAEENNIKIAFNRFEKNKVENNILYTCKNFNIEILVSEKKCALSNEKNKVSTTVKFKNIFYEGCGFFLQDTKLEEKWILDMIGSEKVIISEYKKVPFIEISLTNKKVVGNNGCANFIANIQVEGKRIHFDAVTSNSKKCKSKSIESIVKNLISNHFVDYYFKESKLYLYLEDDSILIFKKDS